MLLFKTYLFITHEIMLDNSIKTINSKLISPTWNDEFELPDGSYSVADTQDKVEYIVKNMKH